MKKTTILSILVLLSICVLAQNQNNHWFFGRNIGLDFSSEYPVFEYGSGMLSFESSSVISDENGDLLFYTNGGVDTILGETFPGCVWNRNHQVMENGILSDSLTYSVWRQSTLIVPKPTSQSIYYLFTADIFYNNNKGLRYSIIDMSEDNGNGAVTSKGILLLDSLGPGLSAYPCSNGIDYWLVVNKKRNNSLSEHDFYVYRITPDSIFLSNTFPNATNITSLNYSKFSPNGQYYICGSALYNFDNSIGEITFITDLEQTFSLAEFSPNSQVLYAASGASTAFHLEQFDLTAPDILNSKVSLDSNIQHGDLKLAPNGKIYIIDVFNDEINCINNPNVLGVNCNYSYNVLYLNNLDTYFSFPNTLISYNSPADKVELNNTPNKLLIFPNPFSKIINIEADNVFMNGTIYIYNIEGQELLRTIVNKNTIKLNFESHPNGIYFVKIINGNNSETKKILKQ